MPKNLTGFSGAGNFAVECFSTEIINILKTKIMEKKKTFFRLAITIVTMIAYLYAPSQICQSLKPKILEGGFHYMPGPHQISVKHMERNDMVFTNDECKAHEEQPTYQVDFVLDFDESHSKAKEIRIINSDSQIFNRRLVLGSNIMTITAGCYDIIAMFDELDTSQDYDWPLYTMYVVREQVVIEQDTTINLAASEAKNHIHFQTLTLEGEPVNTGKYYLDENYELVVQEQGNTDDVIFENSIYINDYNYKYNVTGNFGMTIEGQDYHQIAAEDMGDYYINNVSDRYSFYTYRTALKGHNVFTSSCKVQGCSDDITVSNNPDDFKLFSEPFISPKHLDEEIFMEFSYFIRSIDSPTWLTTKIGLDEPLNEGELCNYYLSASCEDVIEGYVPYIIPETDIRTLVTEYGFEFEESITILTSPPITKKNNEVIIANMGTDRFVFNYNEESDYIEFCPFWPSHPIFTYSVDKKLDLFGNSCTLLVSNPLQFDFTIDYNEFPITYHGNEIYYVYLGRYGETKDDVPDTKFVIEQNGEEVITGQGEIQLDDFLNGNVNVSIINESVMVDDKIGSNKAHLFYNAEADDKTPPTATMLHFINSNNEVTDRFSTAADGTIEFSAGDFNFRAVTLVGYAGYDRYAPESVEVEYSPYGEDVWNELPVEEVPDNYWPVMGWFYTGSLASVTGQGQDGWFDLKIKLTDAAGNWQEQVISPAFRIDDLAYSSVATVGSDNAHEVARYTLDGRRADANTKGVVIVKMSDGTARKVIVP